MLERKFVYEEEDMRELIFTIPELRPISENDIRSTHWGGLAREQKKYKYAAALILNSQFNSKSYNRLTAPVGVYINYRFDDTRHRDQDNYTSGSGKWLLDLLKNYWIGDDTAKDCQLFVSIKEGCDKMETLIRIVEIGEDDEAD